MSETIEQLKRIMQMGYALMGEDFQFTFAYIQISRKLEEKGFYDWWSKNRKWS